MTVNAECYFVPEGFTLLERGGPYMGMAIGKLHYCQLGKAIVLGMHVEQRHTNILGIAHGGMLASLADAALGIGISTACGGRQTFVTVSLTTDFIAMAKPGEWIEAHAVVQKIGSNMAFASCEIHAGEKCILRASGVFAAVKPAGTPTLLDGTSRLLSL